MAVKKTNGIVRAVGDFQFWCTIEEDHDDSITLTKNPVQKGVNVTDHYYPNPRKLKLFVGNVDSERGGMDPRETYQKVKECMYAGKLLRVETAKDSYENMAIVHITTKTDKRTENTIELHIELEELLIVETATTTVRVAPGKNSSSSTKPGTSSTKNGGRTGADRIAGGGNNDPQSSSKNSTAGDTIRSWKDTLKRGARTTFGY